jgi:diguanylate cyclase (GGDEF)-like protein/PAS domain S-box-containing protein
MDFQFNAYLFAAPLSALAALITAVTMLRRRATARARSLGIFLLLMCAWLLSNTLELVAQSQAATVLWAQITYVFIHSGMVVWLIFAVHYADLFRLRWWHLGLLSLLPLATFVLVFTNPSHHLIWQSYIFRQGSHFLAMSVQYGAWFWVQAVYLYVLILLGTFFIIQRYFQSFHVFRQRSKVVLIGATLPLATNFIYISKLIPAFQKDYSAISFALAGILFSWGIFRSRTLDLSPVALNAVIDIISDGMIVIDHEEQVIDANPAALQILGKPEVEVYGQHIREVFINWSEILAQHHVRTAAPNEIVLGTPEQPRYFECKVSDLHNRRARLDGRAIILHEVTERVQLLQTVQELAITDPLTQIANRRYFFENAEREFKRALRYGRDLSLILFDIDRFKAVNDRYGHLVGDQVLADLAQYCRRHTRSIDLLARFGGEEFVILMPETGQKEAVDAAERLRKSIESRNFRYNDQVISITLSLGVVGVSQDNALTLTHYLERADRAMYAAKQAGRNGVASWSERLVIRM